MYIKDNMNDFCKVLIIFYENNLINFEVHGYFRKYSSYIPRSQNFMNSYDPKVKT